MKTKIVEYFATEIQAKLMDVSSELNDLRRNYPDLLGNKTDRGPGLDLAVAKEKLDAAMKLVNLLT